ncbi:54S ribosomal protein L4 mitochondrial [Coemansia erecta]|uniref:Large ribosomal subunit protein uL29m n=1 Tax=Coemansia asiatica TaxID=1052880 RepID=A0A9W7XJG0_9FUNG|nr:54S ribosomal protein L4 mitochondrial [Coemansia asiatica]KAJ2843073.1 54S ribosomal protein L4 mitochondrial [Coemansia erecta]KAJ2883994.1 54S ribosomal protein L4 mitochondrial [Coemansia asiatica]
MVNVFGAVTRQLSTRRLAQNSGFVSRGLEEFFEKGQRLPEKKDSTGRSWAASELRQKSWEDLQKLWYVILKERNVLASQKEECRRLSIPSQFFSNKARVVKCKKTMARIKTVLNERQLAWKKSQEEALKQEKEKNKEQSRKIAASKLSATATTETSKTPASEPAVPA